ncbi:hypothetical protein L1987_20582 [Smallanthus sonchifolius]|uniref:Uncharacterized protein n=1 Tax=Smallanthus sonchifolius TaxID=185202 RepID=A0ACB9ITU2_9ASTR|nr:hypothetical protein L1987_20582 [Smallanthus sonchifolius]
MFDIILSFTDDEVDNENIVKDATDTDEHKGGAANEKVNESGGDEKSGPNNEEHEEKKNGGDDEEEQEGGDDEHEHPDVNDIRFDDPDQEKETLIFMRTWLMEHAEYKQEDTQD